MKGRKKKVMTIDDLINLDKRDMYSTKYANSIAAAKQSENTAKLIDKLKLGDVGKYSLKTAIKNSSWVKGGRPASKALAWLYQTCFKNPQIYRYNHRLLAQGCLYTFQYFNPKYKGTDKLPFFDKYPLVLSIGPIVTKLGPRTLGFNLHYLPPKIRVIAICRIFELYKKLYRYNIFFNKEEPVQIHYNVIIKAMNQFGIRFSIKCYIPNRMNQIVYFPFRDWSKAVFLPSRSYDGIRSAVLIKEWQKFCKREGYSTRVNVNWQSYV